MLFRSRRGPAAPWALRPAVAAAAVAVLFALLFWFGAELVTAGGQVGLAERATGVGEALWPLAVVISCARVPRRRYAVASALRWLVCWARRRVAGERRTVQTATSGWC